MMSELNFAENYLPSSTDSCYKLEKLGRPYWNSVNKLLCRFLPFTVIYIVYCAQSGPISPSPHLPYLLGQVYIAPPHAL